MLSVRGTQRQFLENTCSEDDLNSRIFGTFVVKFLACLPLLGFSKWYNCPFLTDFLPSKGHLEFSGAFFLAEIFQKVSFDPYTFRSLDFRLGNPNR